MSAYGDLDAPKPRLYSTGRQTITVKPKAIAEFLAAQEQHAAALAGVGLPAIRHEPPGYWLDVPLVAAAADAAASGIRKRESERQKRDVPVEYTAHRSGDAIEVVLTWRGMA